MILRVLLPLQLLGTPKHALAFHVFPAAGQMFRSSFNVKALLRSSLSGRAMLPVQQQQQQRTAKALAVATARDSSTGIARATTSTIEEEKSNTRVLGNDGQWIDYEKAFKHPPRGNEVCMYDVQIERFHPFALDGQHTLLVLGYLDYSVPTTKATSAVLSRLP